MKVVSIITAMQTEFNAIKTMADWQSFDEGILIAKLNDKVLYLIKSGIGKVNATIATIKAKDLNSDLVISTGIAGGIDKSLSIGDVVFSNSVNYHDVWCGEPNLKGQVQDLPSVFEIDENLLNDLTKNITQDYHVGKIVTGDQFILGSEPLLRIKSDFSDALAVDMESAAIAHTCYIKNMKFVSIRLISDVVGNEYQQDEYDSFWDNSSNCTADIVKTAIDSL